MFRLSIARECYILPDLIHYLMWFNLDHGESIHILESCLGSELHVIVKQFLIFYTTGTFLYFRCFYTMWFNRNRGEYNIFYSDFRETLWPMSTWTYCWPQDSACH